MRRQPAGSPTAFNRQIALGMVRVVGHGADRSDPATVAGLVTNAGDAVCAALGRDVHALADLFVDPQSVELIRNANNRGARIGMGDALARTAAKGGGML